MVNFPNSAASQDASIERRLAASNLHIQEMLDEHRQIVQEMDTLRAQAEQLAQLNAARLQCQNQINEDESSDSDLQKDNVADEAAYASNENLTAENSDAKLTRVDETDVNENADTESKQEDVSSEAKETMVDVDDTDPESLEYIKNKIAEIAKLKEQFKRVQNMINTTAMIEEHLAVKEGRQNQLDAISTESTTTSDSNTASQSDSTNANNESVLSSMLNVFTEFNTDLRDQVQSLREERERIRALKEELISRKQQPN